jgi:hypothetical protein
MGSEYVSSESDRGADPKDADSWEASSSEDQYGSEQ